MSQITFFLCQQFLKEQQISKASDERSSNRHKPFNQRQYEINAFPVASLLSMYGRTSGRISVPLLFLSKSSSDGHG